MKMNMMYQNKELINWKQTYLIKCLQKRKENMEQYNNNNLFKKKYNNLLKKKYNNLLKNN